MLFNRTDKGKISCFLTITNMVFRHYPNRMQSYGQAVRVVCMYLTNCFLFKSEKHGSAQNCIAKF